MPRGLGIPALVLAVVIGLLWCQRPGLEVQRFELELNPYGKTPLAAQARLETSGPCRVRAVRVVGGVESQVSPTQMKTAHTLAVLGLKPGRAQEVVLVLEGSNGEVLETEPRRVTTAPLPQDFPNIKVVHPPVANFGFTLVFASLWRDRAKFPERGYLMALTPAGEVVWYQHFEMLPTEIKMSPTGQLWIQDLWGGRIFAQDFLGRQQGQFVATQPGASSPAAPQRSGWNVAVDSFHHDFHFKGGHLWTLGTRVAGGLIDDLILEIGPDGKIERELSVYEHLDPDRHVYPVRPGLWDRLYDKVLEDWSHANSLELGEQTALVSLRHQDAVVEFDLETGRPNWILAPPEGWSDKFDKLRLQADGDFQWPRRQHSAKWSRSGTLILYDNGRVRSRVLELMVDRLNMRVRQIWEYGGQEPFYSHFLGEVDESAESENLIITDGGRLDREKGQFWARIVEVTRDQPARVVYELHFTRPGTPGCTVYRSERYRSLYGGG